MGGSSKQTVGYKYFLGMHQVYTHGPIDALYELIVEKKRAWIGKVTANQRIEIDKEELFGGEDREGGIEGDVDVEFGLLTQGVNDYLAEQQGATTSANRGLFGLVLRRPYLGNTGYLKPWAAVLQRVHVRQEGIEQWYDAKAGVPRGPLNSGENVEGVLLHMTFESSATEVNEGDTTAGSMGEAGIPLPSIVDGAAWFASPGDAPLPDTGSGILLSPPVTLEPGIDWTIKAWIVNSGDTEAWYAAFRQAPGDLGFSYLSVGPIAVENPEGGARMALLGADFPSNSDNHLASPFTAETGSTTLVEIRNRVSEGKSQLLINGVVVSEDAEIENVPFEISYIGAYKQSNVGTPDWYWYGGGLAELLITSASVPPDREDMNPSHIIRECLTDPDWGMGYEEETHIDDTAFMAAADTLYDERMGMSLLWDRQIPIEDFIKEVLKHIDGVLYVDRTTGKFVLKLIRDDYDEETLLVLDEDNVDKVTDFNERRFEELVNSVTVKYHDADTWTDAAITVQDLAQVHMQNAVVNTAVDYTGFTHPNIAARVAARDLKTLSSPLITCTIYAKMAAKDLTIGEPFKLSWPDYGIASVVMRVNSIALGDGKSNQIKIMASQDVYALPSTEYVTQEPGEWVDPNAAPSAAQASMVMEAPYWALVQAKGVNAVNTELAADSDTGYVGSAAVVPTAGAINAVLSTNPGAAYEDVATLDFCPSALLGAAVEFGSTSVTLTDPTDLDDVEAGTLAQCNDELWVVVSIVGDVLTMERGALDTVPVEHAIGDRIYFWGSGPSVGADPTAYTGGQEVDVKVRPVTGLGTLSLAAAPEQTVTLDSRAVRPLPPGNVQINGAYFPTTPLDGSTIDVTWAHRDRLQQTAETIVTFTDGSVGPELGTQYYLSLFESDGTTVVSTTSATGTSASLPMPDDAGEYFLQLKSRRGAYDSWQAHFIPVDVVGRTSLLTETEGSILTEDGESILTEEPRFVNYGEASSWVIISASDVTDGNCQVIFYRWTGADGTDESFDPSPLPMIGRIRTYLNQGFGEPDLYNAEGIYTISTTQPPHTWLERLNDMQSDGKEGDVSLQEALLDSGAPTTPYQIFRRNGTPSGLHLCQDFDTVTDFYQHGIVFPRGQQVYAPMYPLTGASAYPGTAGTANPPPEYTWLVFGYSTIPQFPYPDGAQLLIHVGTGFQEALTEARAQRVIVFFEGPAVPGATYRITLDGVNFDYVALETDDIGDVRTALVALVDASANYSAFIEVGWSNIHIDGAPAVEYTHAASILPI